MRHFSHAARPARREKRQAPGIRRSEGHRRTKGWKGGLAKNVLSLYSQAKIEPEAAGLKVVGLRCPTFASNLDDTTLSLRWHYPLDTPSAQNFPHR